MTADNDIHQESIRPKSKKLEVQDRYRRALAIGFLCIFLGILIFYGNQVIRSVKRPTPPLDTLQNIPVYDLEKFRPPEDKTEKIRVLKRQVLDGVMNPGVYEELVESYRLAKRLEDANEFFKSLVIEQPDNYLAHYALGLVHYHVKVYSSAIDQFNETLRLNPGFLSARQKIADSYAMARDFHRAILYGSKVLEKAEALNDPIAIANASGNLAQCYIGLGQFRKAQRLQENALEIHKKIGKKWDTAVDYINLARIYMGIGNPTMVNHYLNEAMQIAQQLDDRILIVQVLSQQAAYYRNIGDQQSFLSAITRASNILKDMAGGEIELVTPPRRRGGSR